MIKENMTTFSYHRHIHKRGRKISSQVTSFWIHILPHPRGKMELAKFRGASDGKVTKSGSHRAVRFSSKRRHLLSELAGGVGPGGRISLTLLSPGGWKQSRPTGTSAMWFPARRCLGPMVPPPARGPGRPYRLRFSMANRNNVCVHTDKGSWFKKLSPWDNRLLFLWGRYFIKMTFLMT